MEDEPKRRFLVGGNWKMNGDQRSILEICKFLSNSNLDPNTEVVIGVPSIFLMLARNLLPCEIHVAGQNAYKEAKGAYTGEISPAMLKDVNIHWVILGHSERRQLFKEADELIAEKMEHALQEELSVIACIGETLKERQADETKSVLSHQLCEMAKKVRQWQNVVVAYEPVWAIGTGQTATPEQAQEIHEFIRGWIKKNLKTEIAENIRILYGGSVNAENALELKKMPDIDGFLVGGASLKPEFVDIINCNRL